MAIPAVPAYLGKEYLHTASPALRFGLYLPVWTGHDDQEKQIHARARKRSPEARELQSFLEHHGMNDTIAAWMGRGRNPLPALWEKDKEGAKKAWKSVTGFNPEFNPNDQDCMKALAARQAIMSASYSAREQMLILHAKAIAPFTTGLGNEHPLENGFAFLNPYGLPYLPGSGVKGVLRQAARELVSGDWGEACAWDDDAIDALFGKEDSKEARRGALSFWDVIPQLKGNTLQVEVMTAHQGHYYQDGDSPHESGKVNPINFLTVPPGSGFTFHVQCNLPFLSALAPELARDSRWKELLQAAFTHAFDWLGFGAKTAVGYGHMQIDAQRTEQIRQEQEEEERKQARQKELEAAVSGLPEDAAWVETQNHSGAWQDNNRLLGDLEAFLDGHEKLSQEALHRLRDILDQHWKGIIENPDATRGRRNKPSFKPRPRELARRLIAMLGKA